MFIIYEDTDSDSIDIVLFNGSYEHINDFGMELDIRNLAIYVDHIVMKMRATGKCKHVEDISTYTG